MYMYTVRTCRVIASVIYRNTCHVVAYTCCIAAAFRDCVLSICKHDIYYIHAMNGYDPIHVYIYIVYT